MLYEPSHCRRRREGEKQRRKENGEQGRLRKHSTNIPDLPLSTFSFSPIALPLPTFSIFISQGFFPFFLSLTLLLRSFIFPNSFSVILQLTPNHFPLTPLNLLEASSPLNPSATLSDSYRSLLLLFVFVFFFLMLPLFNRNNIGMEQWNDRISWYRMGQPRVWPSTHGLYVYHEMHSRRNLLQRWTKAFWEHWIEPLRWNSKLRPGWLMFYLRHSIVNFRFVELLLTWKQCLIDIWICLGKLCLVLHCNVLELKSN